MSSNLIINSAFDLWEALKLTHDDRIKRIESLFTPTSQDIDLFLKDLQEADTNNWIANNRWGAVGNPYEQISEDFGVLNEAAKRLVLAEKKSSA